MKMRLCDCGRSNPDNAIHCVKCGECLTCNDDVCDLSELQERLQREHSETDRIVNAILRNHPRYAKERVKDDQR